MMGVRATACVIVLTLLCATGAAADELQFRFSIRPQQLSQALLKFSRQSNLQVVASSRLVSRLMSKGVTGELTIDQALPALLDGTGLTYELLGQYSVRIVARRESAVAATPSVEPATSAPDSSQIELPLLSVVTVTARRREEPAQDVPVSITTIGDSTWIERDLKAAFDMEKNVAGLTICCSRNDTGYTYLRGVKGVVAYWSEVPVDLSGAGLYFDMQNVQVLKGPQGTLFGLSTNGGAILNEPMRPSHRFGGFSSVVVGSRQRLTAEGALNLPVSDTLQLRVGGQSSQTDGYIYDVSNGEHYGGETSWIGRVSAQWQPSSRFSNYAVFNYFDYRGTPMTSAGPAVIEAFNPNGPAREAFGEAAVDAYMASQHALGRYAIPGTTIPGGPWSRSKQYNLIDIAALELGEQLTWRTIAGLQSVRTDNVYDMDTTTFPSSGTSLPNPRLAGPTRTWTVEPQLQGTALDRNLTYTIGSFNRWIEAPPPVAQYTYSLGNRVGTMTRNEATTHAVYAEGEYALDHSISVTAGYRRSWDRRRSSTQNLTADGELAGPVRPRRAEWSEGSYRVGVLFKPNTHTLLYLTQSKGYSSGGFNVGNLPASLQSYGPESLDNSELGIKSDWFSGAAQMRANFALYHGRYDDIQVFVETAYRNPDTGVLQSTLATQNAAKGRIRGVEGELTFIPMPTVELSANFSYMEAAYTRFEASDPADPTGERVVDLRRVPFPLTPRWKYSLSGSYRLPLQSAFGALSIGASFNWQDETATTSRLRGAHPYVYSQPLHNLDANVTWRNVTGFDGLHAFLTFTNLLREDRLNSVLTGYDTFGTISYGVAPPRTWGLRLRYDF